MSPRTGRPKIDKPKSVEVKIRFDKEGNEKLLAYCEKHGITRTEAIRKAVEMMIEADN
jgi:predicted DNA-binding protein